MVSMKSHGVLIVRGSDACASMRRECRYIQDLPRGRPSLMLDDLLVIYIVIAVYIIYKCMLHFLYVTIFISLSLFFGHILLVAELNNACF